MPDVDVISEIRSLYETADRFAREVTQFRDAVSIPSHNELRYAGHHILQSINYEGVVADADQLRKAINHCERAMYEAAEAGIISALSLMDAFHNEHKGLVVSEVVSDYIGIRVLARNAQSLLAKGRDDRATIVEHVSAYMDTFRELRRALETLDASRDDLAAKRAKQVSEHQRFLIGAGLTLTGILTAAALALWRLWVFVGE